ncbi:hypothetical protein SAMN05428959_103707 [Duganella sp. CF517]|nr:hypothetical protein SAMN05428959_103707 [Duganella sp. CF517]
MSAMNAVSQKQRSIEPIDSCCDEISDMPAVDGVNRVEWHF